jgi:hypothetical protein
LDNQQSLLITKATGEKVPFAPEKIFNSLRHSGVSDNIIENIIKEVRLKLYPGISTKKIYQFAFKLLKNKSKKSVGRYKLKQAIMELGPTGFPFEIFIAELLKKEGFKTKIGEIIKGHCVNHEIDVIAEKENLFYMIECKFHNQPGYSCENIDKTHAANYTLLNNFTINPEK